MSSKPPSTLLLIFFLAVSVFGLLITPTLLLGTNLGRDNLPYRRVIIGSVFAALCSLGIAAAFFPKSCEGIISYGKNDGFAKHSGRVKSAPMVTLEGHHPRCSKFSPHRVAMRKYQVCAACVGLVLGAVVALIGTAAYFFVGLAFDDISFIAIVLGEIGVSLGLAQFKFGGLSKLLINALFVLASFVILVEVDLVSESLYADLYVFGVIVFWLSTRILLSQWNNSRICRKCGHCELD